MTEQLLAEIERQGVTQKEVATRAKMPQSRLSELATGKRSQRGASERTLEALAKALGCEWKLVPKPKR